MSKIYIADHQRTVRKQLTSILEKIGHEVQEISGGQEAIETVSREVVDLLLLDAELPGMDGYQVLEKLRAARLTSTVPIIMLTSEFSIQSEAKALRLGANFILSKHINHENLALTVRLALKEGQTVPRVESDTPAPVDDSWDDPTFENLGDNEREEAPAAPNGQGLIDTTGKIPALEDLLNGGIRPGAFTMIEGGSGSGKSIICEYFAYGAIVAGSDVAYFSTRHNAEGLAQQMESIGLDLSDTPGRNKLKVYPLASSKKQGDPEAHLARVASDIDCVRRGVVVIDDISSVAAICENRPVLSFFMACQLMCTEEKTIVVTAHTAFFEKNLLSRLNQLFVTNIRLGSQTMGGKADQYLWRPPVKQCGK